LADNGSHDLVVPADRADGQTLDLNLVDVNPGDGGAELPGGDLDQVEVDVWVPPADTQNPQVSIVAPQDGEVVEGAVSVTLEADDNVGIEKIELYVDGTLATTLTTGQREWTWDTTGLMAGNYLLRAMAYDAAGNSEYDEIEVFVDSACDLSGDCPPKSVKIVTPVDGGKVCGTYTIEAVAQDDTGIAQIEFFVGDDSLGVDQTSPYTKEWNTKKVADGEYEVRVVVTDTADQKAFASITVTVDNAVAVCDNPPSVTLDAPVDGAYLDGVVALGATASDDKGVLKVRYLIDNNVLGPDVQYPYDSSWDTTNTDEGVHSLKATAYDTVDQSAEHQITVTVDRTDPTIEWVSPAAETPYHDSVMLEATASDNFVVANVTFFVQGKEPLVVTQSPFKTLLDSSSMQAGYYDLTMTVTDGAGHSQSVDGDFLIDRPPTIEFTAPGSGGAVWGDVEVHATPQDDRGVQSVSLSIDGSSVNTSYGSGAYMWTWETPYAKKTYTLKIEAVDASGQTAVDQIQVNVDYPVTAALL